MGWVGWELQWAQEVKSNYEIIKKLINLYVVTS
jgi:hypothetical protein